MISIRRRTLAMVLALFALISALIFVVSLRDATHEVEELFDARLAQSARILQGLMRADTGEDDAVRARIHAAFAEALSLSGELDVGDEGVLPYDGHPYESRLNFQVWHDGALIMRTGSAPDVPISRIAGGFADEWVGEHRWRVFVLRDAERGLRILVGEREDVRGELVGSIVWQTMLPDIVGVPLLAVLIWVAIGLGLRPLERMAEQIRARDPAHLTPLELAPLPEELAPMQAALNRLLGETARLLESEQRFIADAAHELRTPLAVLRLHAQNALQASAAAEREEALRELRGGIDRVTRVAAQLLALARLDADAAAGPGVEVDVLAEVRRELAQLMPLAFDAGVDVGLAADERGDWRATLEPGAIGILVQNLLSNAVRHVPAGKAVEISLDARADAVALRVVDHGCGVPETQRARLSERFLRLGPSAGAGLGLSIVRRVVERHGGSLRFDETPGGGLSVCLELPRRSSAFRGVPVRACESAQA